MLAPSPIKRIVVLTHALYHALYSQELDLMHLSGPNKSVPPSFKSREYNQENAEMRARLKKRYKEMISGLRNAHDTLLVMVDPLEGIAKGRDNVPGYRDYRDLVKYAVETLGNRATVKQALQFWAGDKEQSQRLAKNLCVEGWGEYREDCVPDEVQYAKRVLEENGFTVTKTFYPKKNTVSRRIAISVEAKRSIRGRDLRLRKPYDWLGHEGPSIDALDNFQRKQVLEMLARQRHRR